MKKVIFLIIMAICAIGSGIIALIKHRISKNLSFQTIKGIK